MTPKLHQERAKIYEFPKRVLPSAGTRHEGGERAQNAATETVTRAEFGDGWYHEAAVREAEQSRKRS